MGLHRVLGLPWRLSGKEPACSAGAVGDARFNLWVRKMPWRRAWQPTPVLLPGESHGQRSLAAATHKVTKSWTRLNNELHMLKSNPQGNDGLREVNKSQK